MDPHHQPPVGMIVCSPYTQYGGVMRVEALGALPYPYAYSYGMPDHLSVAAAAAAAGKRSREDGAEVCRDYLSGKCSRGKNCKYIHYDPYGVAVQRKPSIEVCLDFQRGTCTRGLECKYLHVQSPTAGMEAVGTKRSTEICKDFNRGLCTRGDVCRYLHVTIPTINQQTVEELAKKPKVDGEEENDELERLRAENQVLRSANQQLEEEVAQLRAQLGLPQSHGYTYDHQSDEGAMEAHNVGH